MLDCTFDIANCALVCQDWLRIINNSRAIPKSIIIDAYSPPEGNIMRRFGNVCFHYLNFTEVSEPIARNLQAADAVEFKYCIFPNYAMVRDILVACGNLQRLEFINPKIVDHNWLNVEVPTLSQEIRNLVIDFDDQHSWHILELIQKCSIAVRNVDLSSDVTMTSGEVSTLLSFLEEHYQAELRGIDLNDEKLNQKLINFPRLKLNKLAVHTYLHLESLLRGQSTITHLVLYTNPTIFTQSALTYLPRLTDLEVISEIVYDLKPIEDNAQHFAGLKSLEIALAWEYDCDWLDISFISKLKKLQKFVCLIKSGPPSDLTVCIEAPMLEMREFHIYPVPEFEHGVEIDEESMLSILHQMPNLENLTLICDTTEVIRY
jgi:hypothetical protein